MGAPTLAPARPGGRLTRTRGLRLIRGGCSARRLRPDTRGSRLEGVDALVEVPQLLGDIRELGLDVLDARGAQLLR
eukprot:13145014-Alexandrium_andersonii.AAC.1